MVCTCFVQGWYKVGIYAWEWSLHTKHFTPFVLLTQCEQGCIQKMELGIETLWNLGGATMCLWHMES